MQASVANNTDAIKALIAGGAHTNDMLATLIPNIGRKDISRIGLEKTILTQFYLCQNIVWIGEILLAALLLFVGPAVAFFLAAYYVSNGTPFDHIQSNASFSLLYERDDGVEVSAVALEDRLPSTKAAFYVPAIAILVLVAGMHCILRSVRVGIYALMFALLSALYMEVNIQTIYADPGMPVGQLPVSYGASISYICANVITRGYVFMFVSLTLLALIILKRTNSTDKQANELYFRRRTRKIGTLMVQVGVLLAILTAVLPVKAHNCKYAATYNTRCTSDLFIADAHLVGIAFGLLVSQIGIQLRSAHAGVDPLTPAPALLLLR